MNISCIQKEIPQDLDQKLCQFYESFSVPGLVETKVSRKNFLSAYQAKSNQFRAYYLEDENGQIHGVASFVFYDALYEGHIVKVGVALDLRISQNRQALLEWSRNFLPVLEEIFREEKVSAIFSLINSADTRLTNLFLRPRSVKRALPRYYLFRKVNLITLHGRFPWAPMPVPHVQVNRADTTSLDGLIHFLAKRSHYRSFSTIWDFQSLQDRLHRKMGSKLSDYLIAFDSQKNIAGCLLLEPQSPSQSYVPITYSLVAHNFRQFLKFGSVFGWTRALTKPRSRTGEDQALGLRFISQIHSRNEDIFESLLWTAYESIDRTEFLAYTHCEQDFRLRSPKHWVHSSQPHGLYSVLPPGSQAPDFLSPKHIVNPEIEAPIFF